MNNINWLDPECYISKYFKVKESLWLPQWNKYHTPTENEKWNIWFLAAKLDKVRDIVGRPIIVHCWIRPIDYNTLVGGAQNSAHIYGNACDFHFLGKETSEQCREMRDILVPELGNIGLRMENKAGSWLHMDRNKVPKGGAYYFIP